MKKPAESLDALVREAEMWASGQLSPHDLVDAPEAAPRARESETISLRMPSKQLALIREFARRSDIGYQVLIKRWLDDRLRTEFGKLMATRQDVSHVQVAEDGVLASSHSIRNVIRPGEEAFKLQAPCVMREAASFTGISDTVLKQTTPSC